MSAHLGLSQILIGRQSLMVRIENLREAAVLCSLLEKGNLTSCAFAEPARILEAFSLCSSLL